MDQPDYKECLNCALRILGRRDHSCRELELKLQKRGYDASDIRAVLAECRRLNVLDDRKYAFSHIRYLRRKGYGAHRIRQVLRNKGLAGDLVVAAIEAKCNDADQFHDCRQALAKKLKVSGRACLSADDKPRLYRFLVQRGFPPEIIRQTMDEKIDTV